MEPTACVVFSAEEGKSTKRERASSLEWECLGLFYKLRLGLKPTLLYHSQKILLVVWGFPHSGCEYATLCKSIVSLLSYCPSLLGGKKHISLSHRRVRGAVTSAQLRADNSLHSCDCHHGMLSHIPDVHQICAAFERFRATLKTGRSDTKERPSTGEGACMTLKRPQTLRLAQFWGASAQCNDAA